MGALSSYDAQSNGWSTQQQHKVNNAGVVHSLKPKTLSIVVLYVTNYLQTRTRGATSGVRPNTGDRASATVLTSPETASMVEVLAGAIEEAVCVSSSVDTKSRRSL